MIYLPFLVSIRMKQTSMHRIAQCELNDLKNKICIIYNV